MKLHKGQTNSIQRRSHSKLDNDQEKTASATKMIVNNRENAMTQRKLQKGMQSNNVVQRLDLSSVDYNGLPNAGKKAYRLLDNNRAGFQSIDKSGGDVHATQDGKKRVTSAWKTISDNKGGRNSYLQQTIGWLGNLEDEVSGGYNGGHLIADSMGGSGTWQNMVPQDGPENKWGDWRKYERENKAAIKNTGNPLIVSVNLGYSGNSVLPNSWTSEMTDSNGTSVNWYSGHWQDV